MTIRPIRGGSVYIKPGSTHHICLFDLPESTPQKPKRDMIAVSMLEAAARAKRGEAIIQRVHLTVPEAQFLMSLSLNEMVLLRHDGKEGLFRFDTSAATSKQMWFRHHAFAGKSSDTRAEVSKKPGTIEATKVAVDILGRVRRAKD